MKLIPHTVAWLVLAVLHWTPLSSEDFVPLSYDFLFRTTGLLPVTTTNFHNDCTVRTIFCSNVSCVKNDQSWMCPPESKIGVNLTWLQKNSIAIILLRRTGVCGGEKATSTSRMRMMMIARCSSLRLVCTGAGSLLGGYEGAGSLRVGC